MRALAGQVAARHSEAGFATLCVAGHGLVDYDGIQEDVVAIHECVVFRLVTIGQGDGALVLDTHAFRQLKRNQVFDIIALNGSCTFDNLWQNESQVRSCEYCLLKMKKNYPLPCAACCSRSDS